MDPLSWIGMGMTGIGMLGGLLESRSGYKDPDSYGEGRNMNRYTDPRKLMQQLQSGLGDNSPVSQKYIGQQTSRYTNATGLNSNVGLEMGRRLHRESMDNLLMDAYRNSVGIGMQAQNYVDQRRMEIDIGNRDTKRSFFDQFAQLGGSVWANSDMFKTNKKTKGGMSGGTKSFGSNNGMLGSLGVHYSGGLLGGMSGSGSTPFSAGRKWNNNLSFGVQ